MASKCISATDGVDNPDNTGTQDVDETTYFYYPGVIGLYSLYYLTEYVGTYANGQLKDGPGTEKWFTGGRYIRNLSFFHCPSNVVREHQPKDNEDIVPPLLGDDKNDPTKPGYNNYDLFYRRDWFHEPPYIAAMYDPNDTNYVHDKRNLVESQYPPADTLVTFCIDHRASQERDYTKGHTGDVDMVLFADGTVMSLPAYNVNDPRWSTESSLQVPSAPNPAVWPNPALWFSYQRALKGE
jgi:hypothetical protein